MKAVITFGCRLNASESERIRQFLEKAKVEDVLVVNTCAVTAEAERQARQIIRKLRRENPNKRIVVTGCSATVHPEIYKAMSEVDGIVSNADKGQAAPFVAFSASAQKVLEGREKEKIENKERFQKNDKKALQSEVDVGFNRFFRGIRQDASKNQSYEDRFYDGLLTQTINHVYDLCGFAPLEKRKEEPRGMDQETKWAMNRLMRRTPYETLPLASARATVPERDAEITVLEGIEDRARAFLPIQTGCNNGCTFCLIRIARGPSVSFPAAKIEQQALQFARQGFRELDITGVDITSYREGDLTLGRLVQRLLDVLPKEVHLRLSSLDPAALDASFDEAFANPRVLPFVHLSLQSGDAAVLRRMARRHTSEDLYRLIDRLRGIRHELALGADIIVGFPGETETMFQNTCRLVEEGRISLLHIFPYSDRPGTVADSLMPKVAPEEKKRRAAQLKEVGHRVLEKSLRALKGQNVKVLIEQEKEGSFVGKTEHFFGIRLKQPETCKRALSFHNAFWKMPEPGMSQIRTILPGRFYSVFVTGVEDGPHGKRLVGNCIEELR